MGRGSGHRRRHRSSAARQFSWSVSERGDGGTDGDGWREQVEGGGVGVGGRTSVLQLRLLV